MNKSDFPDRSLLLAVEEAALPTERRHLVALAMNLANSGYYISTDGDATSVTRGIDDAVSKKIARCEEFYVYPKRPESAARVMPPVGKDIGHVSIDDGSIIFDTSDGPLIRILHQIAIVQKPI